MKSVRMALLALACTASFSAHALFGDDEARRAILDLRQRLDATITAQNRLVEDNAQMRRSLLDLQSQIETLRSELARARGQEEQLVRDVAELQRRQQEATQGVEERLRKIESGEGATAPGQGDAGADASAADQGAAAERREYDAALAVFRSGDFRAAQTSFASFVKKHPRSGYAPAALFWLGNAQYATRDYKEAITNFRSLLTAAPHHDKAPEALLSIANCQIELKDTRAARATLDQLVKTYPKSEAAQAGRERLARLR
ncbi:tol-pal system protein YbgF [Comamonadaceae bacterium OH2545_COT-014]|nr:tol-pal system protein YbgF [Comamonadaceae bacterium OH2545_COT-014]